MKELLWVVEAKFVDCSWGICDFGLEKYATTYYTEALKLMNEQQKFVKKSNEWWTKRHFRIAKYRRVVDDDK
jgi:hypothetical protein